MNDFGARLGAAVADRLAAALSKKLKGKNAARHPTPPPRHV
jgi:hypothetical protein